MAVTGLLGYVLIRLRIPITPIILGLVLGTTMENEYRTALILSDGSYGIFVGSGWAILFLSLTVLVIGMQIVSQARRKN